MRYILWAAMMVVLVFLPGCAKDFAGDIDSLSPKDVYSNPGGQIGMQSGLAIGTIRSRDGVRFIRLDEKSCSQVMNPKEIADLKDGTRVFLQYRYVVTSSIADFCTDAILVEWATPIEQGGLSMLNF
jgi:hypothetical protein